MQTKTTAKTAALVFGDLAALYFGLFLTLILRYGSGFYEQFTELHFVPFTIAFIFWILVFYISGLYDIRHLRNTLEFIKNLNLTIAVSALLTVLFFYLVPALGITPKTNLFIFLIIFAVIEVLWRRKFNSITSLSEPPNKVLLIKGTGTKPIEEIIHSNPEWISQIGYQIKIEKSEEEILLNPKEIENISVSENINLVIIPRKLKTSSNLVGILYKLMHKGIEIKDVPGFYEIIARRIPLEDIEESWFLENSINQKKFYDPLKRAAEFAVALTLGIALLPINILIAIITKLSSKGSAIYTQERIGKNGKKFIFYKFRTMLANAEKNGAQWAVPGDSRVTSFGKFLRHTHLDELPQLWNILRGDLSFVGPRPERPEFVEKLKKEIPYYEARLFINPGVTGWAQINHRKDTSKEDVMEKLEYDIYYLKNRSPILDIAIILKTIKTLFITPK